MAIEEHVMWARLRIAMVIADLLLGVIPALAQKPTTVEFPSAFKRPRMADGHPDLNGIWQAFVTADWDLQDHEAQAAHIFGCV
jgi:hypothetical protein